MIGEVPPQCVRSKEWFLLFDYALSQIVIGGSGNDYRDNVISISK